MNEKPNSMNLSNASLQTLMHPTCTENECIIDIHDDQNKSKQQQENDGESKKERLGCYETAMSILRATQLPTKSSLVRRIAIGCAVIGCATTVGFSGYGAMNYWYETSGTSRQMLKQAHCEKNRGQTEIPCECNWFFGQFNEAYLCDLGGTHLCIAVLVKGKGV